MAMAYPQNRQDRLAQALRDNLKKRKEQARERAQTPTSSESSVAEDNKSEDKGGDNT